MRLRGRMAMRGNRGELTLIGVGFRLLAAITATS